MTHPNDTPATQLLDACRLALRYFELQCACSHTLNDAELDTWDAEMQRIEVDMIPKLRNAILMATPPATLQFSPAYSLDQTG